MATHYIKSGSYSKAWRLTYPHSKAKPETVHKRACEMAKTGGFEEATRNLRNELIETEYKGNKRSLEAYLDKLDDAYDLGMQSKQVGSAVAAVRQAMMGLGHDGKDADKDVPRYDSGVRRKPKLKVVDQS